MIHVFFSSFFHKVSEFKITMKIDSVLVYSSARFPPVPNV